MKQNRQGRSTDERLQVSSHVMRGRVDRAAATSRPGGEARSWLHADAETQSRNLACSALYEYCCPKCGMTLRMGQVYVNSVTEFCPRCRELVNTEPSQGILTEGE